MAGKRAVVLLLVAFALSPFAARAHSDGTSCNEGAGPLFPLLLNNDAVGPYVHCHNGDGPNGEKYGYSAAVFAQVPGAGYAGICTDSELPLPSGYRLGPFYGTGDPTAEKMAAQGCDPASYFGIEDFAFDPMAVTLPQGIEMRWKNDGPSDHTSVYAGPLRWDSGVLKPDATFTKKVAQAGTYTYFCRIHPQMKATVSIPVILSPESGSKTTNFKVQLATEKAPARTVYDVQIQKGKGRWLVYQKDVRASSVTFRAGALGKGTFSFRSRVRRAGGSLATDWSPPRSVTVS